MVSLDMGEQAFMHADRNRARDRWNSLLHHAADIGRVRACVCVCVCVCVWWGLMRWLNDQNERAHGCAA
jgi:hypothetical protein